ncbi:MAG: non-canonical purine NTP pyrophosphatase, RdgB/HAM1 family [Acidobacteria bacterium]|nr:MAG: non-canonical purine NTP pyrophosphatase, RdgB/HAM1 family [Acidobacteriota bacterium]
MTKTRLTTLVLATGNAGKVRELSRIFGDLPFELKSLRDFDGITGMDETGETFVENASLKATGFAVQTRELCLADDSGIEVEALGNAPGVLSARFAGADTGYDVKIERLLAMMRESGSSSRKARFVCGIAVANDRGRIVHTVQAQCRGTIADKPRGTNGFGYDPIFIPDGFGQTFGELGDDVKGSISHRAKAADLIIRYLLDFIARRT